MVAVATVPLRVREVACRETIHAWMSPPVAMVGAPGRTEYLKPPDGAAVICTRPSYAASLAPVISTQSPTA